LSAILGLNVRSDLDIERQPEGFVVFLATSVLTYSDGLLMGYKVAYQFEFHPLHTPVSRIRYFRRIVRKNPHIRGF
jgi:hypothetical protein